MNIKSSVFEEGGDIPQKYSCDGEDISPPLSWSGAPETTKSFALISDDPDAPMGTWVHWVIYNIPGSSSGLDEDVPADETLSDGSMQGQNSWNRIGYGGPCPPGGTHRYYFKLYALDTELDLKPGASKKELERAMKGHVVAEEQIMGRFSR
jgi:Raf kinase inhibitor-like YbhB/YbcL family protein